MYTLYYSPGACSMAVHAALIETGAKFELVKAELQGATKNERLLKVNSRHQVPVLEDDGLVVREGAAILIHLLEKEGSALLPKSGPERTRTLEWLCWANSTLHPKYGVGFRVKALSDDPKAQESIAKFVCADIQKAWNDADAHLANNKYLAGDSVTIADILMAVVANWTPKMPGTITLGANVKRVLKEITSRPAFQKALADENVEYKAAA